MTHHVSDFGSPALLPGTLLHMPGRYYEQEYGVYIGAEDYGRAGVEQVYAVYWFGGDKAPRRVLYSSDVWLKTIAISGACDVDKDVIV